METNGNLEKCMLLLNTAMIFRVNHLSFGRLFVVSDSDSRWKETFIASSQDQSNSPEN